MHPTYSKKKRFLLWAAMKYKSWDAVRKCLTREQKLMMTSQLFNAVGKGRVRCIDWRLKLMKYTWETSCTFLTGVINLWNNLPTTVVDSPQLFQFSHEQELEKKILLLRSGQRLGAGCNDLGNLCTNTFQLKKLF